MQCIHLFIEVFLNSSQLLLKVQSLGLQLTSQQICVLESIRLNSSVLINVYSYTSSCSESTFSLSPI